MTTTNRYSKATTGSYFRLRAVWHESGLPKPVAEPASNCLLWLSLGNSSSLLSWHFCDNGGLSVCLLFVVVTKLKDLLTECFWRQVHSGSYIDVLAMIKVRLCQEVAGPCHVPTLFATITNLCHSTTALHKKRLNLGILAGDRRQSTKFCHCSQEISIVFVLNLLCTHVACKKILCNFCTRITLLPFFKICVGKMHFQELQLACFHARKHRHEHGWKPRCCSYTISKFI